MYYPTVSILQFDVVVFDGDAYEPLKRYSDDEYVMVDKETGACEAWHIDEITEKFYTTGEVRMVSDIEDWEE